MPSRSFDHDQSRQNGGRPDGTTALKHWPENIAYGKNDGPMLKALKGLDGGIIRLPGRIKDRPEMICLKRKLDRGRSVRAERRGLRTARAVDG
jgi:hypothetical protein